jgi:hypothetical protein
MLGYNANIRGIGAQWSMLYVALDTSGTTTEPGLTRIVNPGDAEFVSVSACRIITTTTDRTYHLYGKCSGSSNVVLIDVALQEGVTDPDTGAEIYAIEL